MDFFCGLLLDVCGRHTRELHHVLSGQSKFNDQENTNTLSNSNR